MSSRSRADEFGSTSQPNRSGKITSAYPESLSMIFFRGLGTIAPNSTSSLDFLTIEIPKIASPKPSASRIMIGLAPEETSDAEGGPVEPPSKRSRTATYSRNAEETVVGDLDSSGNGQIGPDEKAEWSKGPGKEAKGTGDKVRFDGLRGKGQGI